ncbi:MAG: hypothetical protein RLZ98_89 [Pseudomonadota bacterium]
MAGLGAGGNSRVGMRRNLAREESIALIRFGFDQGINFIDTARSYGTEELVGDAVAEVARDSVVVSTKSGMRDGGKLIGADILRRNLEESLRRLRTDYVDVFHLHAVRPGDYAHARSVLVPELLRMREAGLIRALGITESSPVDHDHDALQLAVADDCWDVIMVAFNMMHQSARSTIFPTTRAKDIGTLMMFVVRNVFSKPALLAETVRKLADEGKLPRDMGGSDEPLAFLIGEGRARSVIDAAYRYVRHEPGVDVVLFGTGSREHMVSNIASINAPPLPDADLARIRALFGELVGVGLDSPDRS